MEPGEADPGASVIRYRRHPLARLALVLPGPIALGLWIAVIAQTGETELVPVVIVLSAGFSVLGGWIGQAPSVALTPQALVARSLRGTETLPWSDITTLERRGDLVWAMTRRGWFVLPVSGTRTPGDDAPRALPLADQVWCTWLARRGARWQPAALDPWSPRRDLKGRVVLRPPFLLRAGLLTMTTYGLVWSLTPYRVPSQRLSAQLGGAALLFGVALTVAIAYHLWARVTIDDEYLVTRSLTGGVRHIRRGDVLEVRETPGTDRVALVEVTRLVLRHAEPQLTPPPGSMWWASERVTTLTAPVASGRAWANDPAFHRIWAWLYDELIGDGVTATDERAAPPA